MGTVVSKRRGSEVSESTAAKIRVVAAFQNNCKDNSGQQSSSSSVTESTGMTVNQKAQIKASVANTKFPKGVYPQRESNLSLAASKENTQHANHMQPYRLKLGALTSSGTQPDSDPPASHDDKLEELSKSAAAAAVVQLQPGSQDHLYEEQQAEQIPEELDWVVKKGLTPAEIHKAATVIQKTVRGYQCRRKLVKEQKSAAMIQRSFRHWKSFLQQRKNTNGEKMFIPTSSIPTSAAATVNEPVTTNMTQTVEDHVQQLKSKQLDSINEDTVSEPTAASSDELNSTSVTAVSNNDNSSGEQSTNSDIAIALKEVLNIVIPDFNDTQSPNEKRIINMEVLGQRTREHLNALYRSSLVNNSRNKALRIGKEQFKMYLEFQNEIDETMFLAQQKAELCLGKSYIPRKVLLISSRVPKVQLLQCAILPEVITFVYDFERATYWELINKIANALDEYMNGAKIKNLGIICKGGPGCLYLFANKPVTPVKLFKDHKMMIFWKVLGAMMSKLVPEETVIHFMESNVNGNKQGEQLLKDLEKLMYPSKVNVKCPLEIGANGQLMISSYFHPPKYRLWKQKRYTKLKLY